MYPSPARFPARSSRMPVNNDDRCRWPRRDHACLPTIPVGCGSLSWPGGSLDPSVPTSIVTGAPAGSSTSSTDRTGPEFGPDEIGFLMGNPRNRNQETIESGFWSCFRQYAPDLALLEPGTIFESAAAAQEMTEKLIADHADLAGLYISGGGISGALAAFRSCGNARSMVGLGYDQMDVTRAARIDGSMSLVTSHPRHASLTMPSTA